MYHLLKKKSAGSEVKSHLLTKVMFTCWLVWPYFFRNGVWNIGAMIISKRKITYLEKSLLQWPFGINSNSILDNPSSFIHFTLPNHLFIFVFKSYCNLSILPCQYIPCIVYAYKTSIKFHAVHCHYNRSTCAEWPNINFISNPLHLNIESDTWGKTASILGNIKEDLWSFSNNLVFMLQVFTNREHKKINLWTSNCGSCNFIFGK